MLRHAPTFLVCASLLGCGSERTKAIDGADTPPAERTSAAASTTGDASASDRAIEPSSTASPHGSVFASVPTGKVKHLSVGSGHACAVMSDETLSCWSTPDALFPLGTVPAGKFRSVHVGSSSTCALTIEGTVVCFSSSDSDTEPPSGAIEELCHDYHPCIRHADGTAECFNEEPDQTLGLVRPGSLTCGSSWSCALTRERTIRCVVADNVGALGSEFMEAANWELPTEPVEHVFSGYQHGCAMKADGTVMCWGRDTAGETAAPPGAFTTLALGEKLSCGLRPNGSIECWGASRPGPWPGPFTALGVTTHRDENNAVCAVRQDSTVACWDI
jgi:hypothetical protein